MQKGGIYRLQQRKRHTKVYMPLSWLTPKEADDIPNQPKERLVKLVLKFNKEILDIFSAYIQLWDEWTKLNPKGAALTSNEVDEFMRSITKPPGGEDGCSDFEFQVRKKYFKEDGTECPYFRCRYWIDRPDLANCFHLVNEKAAEDEGWTLAEIANNPNLISHGTLSGERIRQLEVSALEKVAKGAKNVPDILDFLNRLKRRRKNTNGLRNKSSPSESK